MIRHETIVRDPLEVGLAALAWTLGDAERGQRLLALTGLEPNDLRARAAEPAMLAATLGFLEAHEPDLVACADALELAPADLAAARAELET